MLIPYITATAVMAASLLPHSSALSLARQGSASRLSSQVEGLLLDVAGLFFWPVLAAVLAALVYALVGSGAAAAEWLHIRRRGGMSDFLGAVPDQSVDGLELAILKELEGLRLCSRVSPMLGLIATMIPLGPALVGATERGGGGEVAQLAPAFATVILALVAASLSFVLHTVRRRWLLEELHRRVSVHGANA